MLHLFDKTYIDLDAFISPDDQRFVISQDYGQPLLDILKQIQSGELIGHGLNIDELVGSGKTYANVFQLLSTCASKNKSSGDRVIIYCDKAAYLRLSSLWFKTIFANISAEAAYLIVKLEFARSALMNKTGQGHTYKNTMPTLEEFTSVFNSAVVDITSADAVALLGTVHSSRSIEFLFASYFYNGSYKEELRAIFQLFMTRRVTDILKDSYGLVVKNVLNPEFHTRFGTQTYTVDNMTDIGNDPKFATLRRVVAGNLKLTDIDATQAADLQGVINAVRTFMSERESTVQACFQQSVEYLDYLPGGINDTELDELIAKSLTFTDFIGRFWPTRDYMNVNLYLMEKINQFKVNNQLNELAPYLLR